MGYEINVLEKTGFVVTDVTQPIVIRDARGRLFYSTESLTPKVKAFNLPGFGKYLVDSGSFKPMKTPVNFPLLWLPAPERDHPPAKDFVIKWEDNPHKCTIDFTKKEIVFDKSFLEKTLPEIYFIYYHEISHRYFKTEKWVDIMADNYMRLKGFNPSQIGYAHITTLSERQAHRKTFHINRIIEQGVNA